MEAVIVLKDQEEEGNYDFLHAKHYMTPGVRDFFSGEGGSCVNQPFQKHVADGIVLGTLHKMLGMIHERYGKNADYLQVFDCTLGEKKEKVFAIHDESHVTFMLAKEY